MFSVKDFLARSGCEPKLAELIGDIIPIAVKQIRAAISSDSRGLGGGSNASGDTQLALDVASNEIVIEELEASGLVQSMASEEMEEVVFTENNNAPFAVVFDPLDGSSLADVNFAVGSIFGVYQSGPLLERTGDDQLASCFAVYGPHTTLVLTVKTGTHEFRLAEDGNFYLMKESLEISLDAKYFAPGNLRAASERRDYFDLIAQFVKDALTLRYSGGMVPDINHILLKGSGVFLYPGYSKMPNGKLRLLFECSPMSLLIEQAKGAAVDHNGDRILSKKLAKIHEPSPIFLGSANTVARCISELKVVS